jgi:GNAT superfamily N-acetyltransferase
LTQSGLDLTRSMATVPSPFIVARSNESGLGIAHASSSWRITSDLSEVSAEQVAQLYESVGFGIADDYRADGQLISKLFAPGVYGFFAKDRSGNSLLGMIRLLSDDYLTSWIAEVCVHPACQRQGIGSALVRAASERFSHTSIYAEVLSDQTARFAACGITPRDKLIACSRGALPSH